jgi:hypothetical protein
MFQKKFLKDFKHDLKLFNFITKKKEEIAKSLMYSVSVSLFSLNQVKLSPRFVNRIRDLSMNSLFAEMKSTMLFLKIHLKSMISFEKYSKIIQLLFHYKYLNSADFTNLFATDLIMHRVRLILKIKFNFKSQKKWSSQKKWWLRKLIQQEIDEDIYEKIDKWDDKLSSWNVQTMLVNKIKNSEFADESRMTFNYSRVVKKLSEVYMFFISFCHNYLSNSRHECFMITDLKHVYLMIHVYLNDW